MENSANTYLAWYIFKYQKQRENPFLKEVITSICNLAYIDTTILNYFHIFWHFQAKPAQNFKLMAMWAKLKITSFRIEFSCHLDSRNFLQTINYFFTIFSYMLIIYLNLLFSGKCNELTFSSNKGHSHKVQIIGELIWARWKWPFIKVSKNRYWKTQNRSPALFC